MGVCLLDFFSYTLGTGYWGNKAQFKEKEKIVFPRWYISSNFMLISFRNRR